MLDVKMAGRRFIMKEYVSPKWEFIEFLNQDIVRTSDCDIWDDVPCDEGCSECDNEGIACTGGMG